MAKNALVSFWLAELELLDWEVECERISILQVSDNFCWVGNNFVGILKDHVRKKATIYHTRTLSKEDVIHELLHVKYPTWSENQVNRKTNELKGRKTYENRILQC